MHTGIEQEESIARAKRSDGSTACNSAGKARSVADEEDGEASLEVHLEIVQNGEEFGLE
jgi:hypothetical protein